MGMDSIYGKRNNGTLEQRARANGNGIDTQWIRENEQNEFYRSSASQYKNMLDGLDPDLQKELAEALSRQDLDVQISPKSTSNEPEYQSEKLQSIAEERKELLAKREEAQKRLDEISRRGDELLAMMKETIEANNAMDDSYTSRGGR